MQEITREEMFWMIENDILKCVRGRYEGLITGSKLKHGKGKPRLVEEPLYDKMMRLKKQQLEKNISVSWYIRRVK